MRFQIRCADHQRGACRGTWVRRALDAPSGRRSARKDQTCSPRGFRTVHHAPTRKSMGPHPKDQLPWVGSVLIISSLQSSDEKSLSKATGPRSGGDASICNASVIATGANGCSVALRADETEGGPRRPTEWPLHNERLRVCDWQPDRSFWASAPGAEPTSCSSIRRASSGAWFPSDQCGLTTLNRCPIATLFFPSHLLSECFQRACANARSPA